jgi:hypothetical protein
MPLAGKENKMRKAMLVVSLMAVTLLGNAAVVHAAPPSNDDITNATVVTAIPFTHSVNTSEATYAATDTGCGFNTVWYQFTPAVSGYIEVNTLGSSYDTTLALHTGQPPALTQVQCNDDFYGLQSRIINEVVAGTPYYISAGTCCGPAPIGYVGDGGELVLNVQSAPPPLTEVTVTVDKSGTVVRNSGLVTITGTITCDQQGFATIYLIGSQRFKRSLAEGSSGTYTACGPVPSVWSVQFRTSTNIIFASGKATVNVTAYANGQDGGFDDTTLTQDVNLHNAK